MPMVVYTEEEMLSREHNLQLFKQYLPEIHQCLLEHSPSSTLVQIMDNVYDIEYQGTRLYGDIDGPTQALEHINSIKGKTHSRVQMVPISRTTQDRAVNIFINGVEYDAKDLGIQFSQHPQIDEAYHLICFGLGLGYHLLELIKVCNPRTICIIEPSLDNLYHSLSVLDWEPILTRIGKHKPSVTIVGAQSPSQIEAEVRMHIRRACVASMDWMLLYQTYPQVIMAMARQRLSVNIGLSNIGVGYFRDELEMVRACYWNHVPADDWKLFQLNDSPIDTPCMVIGSGPSLDQDIAWIRENQKKFILISCGSALATLLANNIIPDFQVLLENDTGPYEQMWSIAEKYSLGHKYHNPLRLTTLIAANTVDHRLKNLFKETVFFVRQGVSSSVLFPFPMASILPYSSPTVSNTGLSAAIQMGFRNIYMFGIDLGVRDNALHHSTDSPYTKPTTDFDTKGQGTFGGIIWTETIMMWARDNIELLIMNTNREKTTFYNCSDGLIIRHTVPIQDKSTINHNHNKFIDLNIIKSNFIKAQNLKAPQLWEAIDWAQKVRDFCDLLREVIRDHVGSYNDLVEKLYPLLLPDFTSPSIFHHYFVRGSFFTALLQGGYYNNRTPPDRLIDIEDIIKHRLCDTLDYMETVGTDFIENIYTLEYSKMLDALPMDRE